MGLRTEVQYRLALGRFKRARAITGRILYDIRPYNKGAHSVAWSEETKAYNALDRVGEESGRTPGQVAQDKIRIMGNVAKEGIRRRARREKIKRFQSRVNSLLHRVS